MINYGKNKNVLSGNFQKTIRFAARLLERLEYSGMPIKRAGTKWQGYPCLLCYLLFM